MTMARKSNAFRIAAPVGEGAGLKKNECAVGRAARPMRRECRRIPGIGQFGKAAQRSQPFTRLRLPVPQLPRPKKILPDLGAGAVGQCCRQFKQLGRDQ